MKELLDKISSYNIFNYLLPGILFSLLTERVTDCQIPRDNLIVAVFFYYFVGLVVSRVGSLVIEPLLKRTSFVTFAPYPHFIEASKKDPTIEVLSENNNMYRTLCAMFVLVFLLPAYNLFERCVPNLQGFRLYILAFALLLMFLFSYRKQTDYVRRRVETVRMAATKPKDK